MAISDVRAAFNTALGDAGNCTNATMGYVPDNRRMQRLTFAVNVGGVVHEVTADVAPGVDLTKKARDMAAAFVAGLEG